MSSGNWGDLRARVLSAIVMVAVGAVAIALGGPVWSALVVLVTALMIWELARITAPEDSAGKHLGAALLAVLSLGGLLIQGGQVMLLALFIVPLGFAFTPRRMKRVAVPYALAIMTAGAGLVSLRTMGVTPLLWLLAVIIVSDVTGYFAGRAFGGPKFWPAISPKKTWSGTVAGWIGAALVGAGFHLVAGAPAALIWLSPLVAFAGQLGDILESWLKRRAGIKDSSNLIPGHGGFLDRFDALLLAAMLVFVAQHILYLSVVGGF